jgi:hypothetical protein
MPGNGDRMHWWCDRAPVAAALAFLLFASGCSGSGNFFGGPNNTMSSQPPAPAAAPPAASAAPSSSHWLPSDISNFFAGASATAPQPVAGASSDVECPFIDIRQGAATLTIREDGGNAAMSLKYQGTFVRAARQCSVVAGQMVIKLGVQGRIVLGPAGGPGEVNVPLRIAVVERKPDHSKTIVTKLINIPVIVRSVDDNPTFTHVEDGLSFPLPSAAELQNYIIYIGFDPLAAEAPAKHERPNPKRKPRLRLRPQPAAPTG